MDEEEEENQKLAPLNLDKIYEDNEKLSEIGGGQ